MDDLFIMLCGGVAASMESLKPAIKTALRIQDTNSRLYHGVIWLVAILLGIAGAFVFQVNLAPARVDVLAGYIITGIAAAFGSEVGHRILEIIAALSLFAQKRAVANTSKDSASVKASVSLEAVDNAVS